MCDAVFTPTGARISVGDDDDNNCDYGTNEWTLVDSLKLGKSKDRKRKKKDRKRFYAQSHIIFTAMKREKRF